MGEASDDRKREKQGGEGEVTDGDGSKPPATKSNLDLGFFCLERVYERESVPPVWTYPPATKSNLDLGFFFVQREFMRERERSSSVDLNVFCFYN